MQLDYQNNYLDFKLTLDNCGEEPIHRPIKVHSHGYLMAWNNTDTSYPLYLSENVPALFNRPINDFWTLQTKDWMPEEMYQVLREMDDPYGWNSVDPIPTIINDKKWNIIRHVYRKTRFLEIEEHYSDKNLLDKNFSSFHQIRIVIEPLNYINHLTELLENFTRNYRRITGYDRVMIYKFDQDNHGKVIGECHKEGLEPFLGLNYPESDIPKIARELFLLNRSRIIPNVEQKTNDLVFNPKMDNPQQFLDLSNTQLRGTSPIHIKYLQNLSISATYTLALIIDHKLWGLIACHNEKPFFVNYEIRKTGELIANNLCRRISEIEFQEEQKERSLGIHKEQELSELLTSSWDVAIQLFNKYDQLQHLVDSDGIAVWVEKIGVKTYGNTPTKPVIEQLVQSSKNGEIDFENSCFLTRNIREILPKNLILEEFVGGAAILKLSQLNDCHIFWFRDSLRSVCEWAGDPSKPYEIDYAANGSIQLSPRRSFERWKGQIEFKSKPWSRTNKEMILRIRDIILKKQGEWKPFGSEIYKRELEQITYAASHDLKEPLQTLKSFLALIKEEMGSVDPEELALYLDTTMKTTDQMANMVDRMLVYSRTGHEVELETVDLNLMMEEVKLSLNHSMIQSKAELIYKNLPLVYGNAFDIKKLLQNLISNAIKYGKPHEAPRIELTVEDLDNKILIGISDNGLGIKKKDFENVFTLFKRVHKSEEKGTGVGLSICRKIVESMGGRIWVDSKEGVGSTFYFTISKAPFEKIKV